MQRRKIPFAVDLGRGGGGYGFRRSNNNDDDEIEVLKDAIFIQNLPRDITRDDIQDAFSTVGPIKVTIAIALREIIGSIFLDERAIGWSKNLDIQRSNDRRRQRSRHRDLRR